MFIKTQRYYLWPQASDQYLGDGAWLCGPSPWEGLHTHPHCPQLPSLPPAALPHPEPCDLHSNGRSPASTPGPGASALCSSMATAGSTERAFLGRAPRGGGRSPDSGAGQPGPRTTCRKGGSRPVGGPPHPGPARPQPHASPQPPPAASALPAFYRSPLGGPYYLSSTSLSSPFATGGLRLALGSQWVLSQSPEVFPPRLHLESYLKI